MASRMQMEAAALSCVLKERPNRIKVGFDRDRDTMTLCDMNVVPRFRMHGGEKLFLGSLEIKKKRLFGLDRERAFHGNPSYPPLGKGRKRGFSPCLRGS